MDLPLSNQEQIVSKVAEIKNPPSLPLAMQRVLELIVTNVKSPDELETFIRYDQGLTARIIRIANSAYYGMLGTARISYEIALRRPWIAKERAYLLGFLHDLGRIIVAAHFGEQYKAIWLLAQKRNSRKIRRARVQSGAHGNWFLDLNRMGAA